MNNPPTIPESALPARETCDVLVIGGGATHPRPTCHAWQRRRNIRDLGPLAGENIVEAQ